MLNFGTKDDLELIFVVENRAPAYKFLFVMDFVL